MSENKKLYNIFHVYDWKDPESNSVEERQFVGTLEATDEEIAEFLKKWNCPAPYGSTNVWAWPCDRLYFGFVLAEEVKISSTETMIPYIRENFINEKHPEENEVDENDLRIRQKMLDYYPRGYNDNGEMMWEKR